MDTQQTGFWPTAEQSRHYSGVVARGVPLLMGFFTDGMGLRCGLVGCVVFVL